MSRCFESCQKDFKVVWSNDEGGTDSAPQNFICTERKDQKHRCSSRLNTHPFLISKLTGDSHESQLFTGQAARTQESFARMTWFLKGAIFLPEGLDSRRGWQPDASHRGEAQSPVR